MIIARTPAGRQPVNWVPGSKPGDAALMLGDFRIEELAAQRLEAFERAFLIRPHQPRIPRDIGGEDRGEAARSGSLPPRPSPSADPRGEKLTLLADSCKEQSSSITLGCDRRTAR